MAIRSVSALESVIGAKPPLVDLKVIDHIDPGARRWLAASPLGFFGFFGAGASVSMTLGGGHPGFASGEGANLRLPLAALNEPDGIRPGVAFGSLFLVPGIGETLRVNGRVAAVGDGAVHVAVEECYAHCAKALIRSAFWSAEPTVEGGEAEAFVASGRFLALATLGADGRADMSPKGDPAGSLARLEGGFLRFADRPGNRRADSFRNIIGQPRIAAALLVPGSDRVALLTGRAHLSTDDADRAPFAVQGKTPLLAICVDDLTLALRRSAALARARPWPAGEPPDNIDPAKLFTAHLRLNKDKGMVARLAGTVASVPGLMRRGLRHDYEHNLY